MINPITVENELPKMTTEQLRELQDVVNQDINAASKNKMQNVQAIYKTQNCELLQELIIWNLAISTIILFSTYQHAI